MTDQSGNLLLQPQQVPVRRLSPDAEALEVVVEGIKAVVPVLVQEMNKTRLEEIQANERVETKRLGDQHMERTVAAQQSHREKLTIIIGVLSAGTVGSILSFYFGNPDLGSAMILAAITGVLGLLAGGGRLSSSSSSQNGK